MQRGGVPSGRAGPAPRYDTAMRRLVVFDLDGTLVDSRQDLAASANDVLAAFGAQPLPVDQVTCLVGDGARALVERALARAGVSADVDAALAHFQKRYSARMLETTRPYDGIDDALRAIGTSARLAVLTNKPLAPAVAVVEAFGWTGLLDGMIGGDGVHGRKPSPAGLRALMAAAGASAARTTLVGDSMVDVRTARAAGVAMCVAGWGFGRDRGDLELGGEEVVAGAPGDLPRLLADRP